METIELVIRMFMRTLMLDLSCELPSKYCKKISYNIIVFLTFAINYALVQFPWL